MIIKEILNRRSVRGYKPDPVSDENINEIIKAGQFAPTAKNNKAVDFVIVKDQKIKEEIFAVCGQDFVKEAPVLIIPVSDTAKTPCPVQDLSVASENMFLQAAALGLGTVWKNLKGELNEAEKIRNILKIPSQYMIINIIPVGYPKDNPQPHNPAEFDVNKIHQGRW
jgi:nitroreductase